MTSLVVALMVAAGAAILLLPPVPAPEPREQRRLPVAPPGVGDAALILELVAAMLAAGRPLGAALEVVGQLCEPDTAGGLKRLAAGLELGLAWEESWALAAGRTAGAIPTADPNPGRSGLMPKTLVDLRYALSYAAGSGAPAARVLQAQAAQLRRRRRRALERRAAVLGVRLVLPLGLCALPAFAALTVLPLLLSLLPQLG